MSLFEKGWAGGGGPNHFWTDKGWFGHDSADGGRPVQYWVGSGCPGHYWAGGGGGRPGQIWAGSSRLRSQLFGGLIVCTDHRYASLCVRFFFSSLDILTRTNPRNSLSLVYKVEIHNENPWLPEMRQKWGRCRHNHSTKHCRMLLDTT